MIMYFFYKSDLFALSQEVLYEQWLCKYRVLNSVPHWKLCDPFPPMVCLMFFFFILFIFMFLCTSCLTFHIKSSDENFINFENKVLAKSRLFKLFHVNGFRIFYVIGLHLLLHYTSTYICVLKWSEFIEIELYKWIHVHAFL